MLIAPDNEAKCKELFAQFDITAEVVRSTDAKIQDFYRATTNSNRSDPYAGKAGEILNGTNNWTSTLFGAPGVLDAVAQSRGINATSGTSFGVASQFATAISLAAGSLDILSVPFYIDAGDNNMAYYKAASGFTNIVGPALNDAGPFGTLGAIALGYGAMHIDSTMQLELIAQDNSELNAYGAITSQNIQTNHDAKIKQEQLQQQLDENGCKR